MGTWVGSGGCMCMGKRREARVYTLLNPKSCMFHVHVCIAIVHIQKPMERDLVQTVGLLSTWLTCINGLFHMVLINYILFDFVAQKVLYTLVYFFES